MPIQRLSEIAMTLILFNFISLLYRGEFRIFKIEPNLWETIKNSTLTFRKSCSHLKTKPYTTPHRNNVRDDVRDRIVTLVRTFASV